MRREHLVRAVHTVARVLVEAFAVVIAEGAQDAVEMLRAVVWLPCVDGVVGGEG